MGGSSGGGGRTPYEAPESGRSKQLVKIVEVISEGEIQGFGATNGGFAEGDGEKSIYFDNTPVRNQDNSHNFNNVQWQGRTGSQNQALLAGFDTTEKEVSVSTEVKKTTPITRTITDPKVNRVRLTLGVSSLFYQNDNGDTHGSNVDFKITVGNRVHNLTINGKYSSQYLRNLVIDNLPRTPFTIKVERVQADSTSQRLQNKTIWASYTEIIDHQFTYPNTALIGIKFDSEYFSNIPTRTYDVLGIKVKVPSNYNPTTRQYSGLWDGSFKIAWTDNPAWILYDIVTNKRYGLGKRLGDFGADKWALYQVAQYCDQLVPDGFGNREPRFTCNVWLTEQRSAYDVINDICSIFRAMPVWNGTTLTVIQDRPSDPVWTYTVANVIGGFSRQYSAMKARHNAIQVEYKDKENNYETAIEYVSDDDAIRKYGLNLKKVQAFGCTSRGQAYRTGRWILETERLETETITFTVGAEGLMHLPGDIIKVADSYYAGTEIGGRVLAVSGRNVTLDREIQINGNSYLSFINANAQHSNIKISAVRGKVVTLDSTPTGLETLGVWSLTTQNISAKLYRAMSVAENEDGSYTITALQHEPQKEAIVDNGATFEPRATTFHQAPKIEHLDVAVSAGNAGISWQAGAGSAIVSYDVKILKNGKLYDLRKGLKTTELDLSELPDGNYQLVIQSRNATGQIVDEKSKTFVIDRPPVPTNVQVTGGLTDVILSWGATDEATQTEIWASERNDQRTAKRVAKVTANIYTHTVGSRQVRFYWLRHTRGQNLGAWYQTQGVRAETGANIDAELEVLNEKLKAPLAREVIETALPARNLELVKTVTNVAVPTQKQGANLLYNQADGKLYRWNGTRYTADVQAGDVEGVIPKSKLDSAMLAELSAATRDIAAERTARSQALQAEAATRGTAVSQLQQADQRQATLLNQTTAKADQALSGIQAEQRARAEAIRAEAEKRLTLVTKVETAESTISALQQSQAMQEQAISETRTQLTARLDNLNIGGRNYVLNSRFANGLQQWSNWGVAERTVLPEGIKLVANDSSIYRGISQVIGGINPNARYALSFDARAELSQIIIGLHFLQNGRILSQSWHRVSAGRRMSRHTVRFTTPNNPEINQIRLMMGGVNGTPYELSLNYIKLEQGDVATDWTPAPEDGESALSSISAEITTYKQTQAQKEQAQAVEKTELSTKLRGMESNIITNSQAVTNLNGTLSALHTIKAQTIANGRTAIAGIALGTNEKESSVIVMADKFAVVKNAQDGNPQSLFAVQNGRVAINGDLVAAGSITGDKLNVNSAQAAILTAGAIRTEHLATAQVSADKLAIGLGGNLLYNPIFANNADGWTRTENHEIVFANSKVEINRETGRWQGNEYLTAENQYRWQPKLKATQTSQARFGQIYQEVNVVKGQWYLLSGFVASHRGVVGIDIEADNGVIGSLTRSYTGNGLWANYNDGLVDCVRIWAKFRALENGVVRCAFSQYTNPGVSSNVFTVLRRPMLEECTEHTITPSPWQNAGVTTIHGGSIKTRSITAEQIGVGQITTEHMTAGTIDARVLKAGTVTADNVVAGVSLSSPKINAGTISGTRMNAGHIEGGTINGAALSGGTITGNTITGGTINGTTISGTTISGGVIRGAHLEGATGKFTGEVEITQLIGGNVIEFVSGVLRKTSRMRTSRVTVSNGSHDRSETHYSYAYEATLHISDAATARYVMSPNNIFEPFVLPAHQSRNIKMERWSEYGDLSASHPNTISVIVMAYAISTNKHLRIN